VVVSLSSGVLDGRLEELVPFELDESSNEDIDRGGMVSFYDLEDPSLTQKWLCGSALGGVIGTFVIRVDTAELAAENATSATHAASGQTPGQCVGGFGRPASSPSPPPGIQPPDRLIGARPTRTIAHPSLAAQDLTGRTDRRLWPIVDATSNAEVLYIWQRVQPGRRHPADRVRQDHEEHQQASPIGIGPYPPHRGLLSAHGIRQETDRLVVERQESLAEDEDPVDRWARDANSIITLRPHRRKRDAQCLMDRLEPRVDGLHLSTDRRRPPRKRVCRAADIRCGNSARHSGSGS
jgi:hypothetical protein